MPAPDGLPTTLSLDAQIKAEAIWGGPLLRPASLLTQRGKPGTVLIRDDKDAWADSGRRLRMSDSMLSEVADSRSAPEVLQVREHIRSWRFYDGFRTDALGPPASRRWARSRRFLTLRAPIWHLRCRRSGS